MNALRPVVLLLCVASLNACNTKKVSSSVNKTADRSRRLTVLAAIEAGAIANADERLTRQLNIAEQVLTRFGPEDALTVLAAASKTLHEVGPSLSDQARVSGWVSVSQLSRRAMDPELAKTATAEARKELEALPDVAERCQFVMGVAEEVSQLDGETEAATVLVKGGEWVTAIEDQAVRRKARLAFAVALFNFDSYEGGVATLKLERDPTWSSDTMLALASPPPEPVMPTNFGRAVSYEKVFQGNRVSASATY